ncbi:MAG: transglutaminase-like domain-containing protein [Eubacteriales bacterium]|nr:transglutaminase-like domain-containing protein [Eubacteriales bacterium]
MSRLREFIRAELGRFLLTALIAWALSRPVLALLDAMPEDLWALLCALVWALVLALFSRLRPPARLLAAGGLLAALILPAFFFPGSLAARAVNFIWTLASGAAPLEASRWYLDALIPMTLLLLALYARLLMDGDPAFSLPLVTAPLLMFWFAGAREDLSLYFPAVLSLPLLYAHGHPAEAKAALTVPENKPKRIRGMKALALALILALLASWLTPAARQTVPQLEQMADRLRQAVEDYFFFTDSRRMFSLSSQGYQPMGDEGLGGKPLIPDSPLMAVHAPEKTYLRGTALDFYNGRAWFDTLSNERYGFQSVRFAGLKSALLDEDLPAGERGQPLEVAVEILDTMPSTLFVPQRLRALAPGEGMVPYFNASSELFITRDLRQGDSYTAGFESYVAGTAYMDGLAERFRGYADPDYGDILEDYTRLPDHLEPGGIIDALAREVAGSIHDPYQQGVALMNYLKSNFRYTLDVPDAPPTLDFASHFLFDIREGYCTYFATAMTVLSRSLGLPARYVEGFLADPQGAESITLTARNAHAWTEIYIQGLGWVTFDATASDGDGDGESPPQSPPPSPEPSPSPSPSPEPTPGPEEGPEESPSPSPAPGEPEPTTTPAPGETSQQGDQDDENDPFPWWLLLVLLLLGLLIWRVKEEEPERRAAKLKDPGGAFAILWQALLTTLKAQGRGILPQETAISYVSRTDPDDAGLMALARAHSALKYGRVTPDRDSLALARIQYRAAWQTLKPWHKARLAISRAVRPLGGYLRRGVKGLWGRVRRKVRRG